MANETTYTTFDDASIAAGVANEHILTALHDLNYVDSLTRFVDLAGVPSKSHKLALMPRLNAAAVSEGVDLQATQVSSTGATVTASEKGIMVVPTDALTLSSLINDADFAMECAMAIAEKQMSDVANLASGFSNSVSNTGVNMTEANYLAGIALLRNARQNGPLAALLYPEMWFDYIASVGSTFNIANGPGSGGSVAEGNQFSGPNFGAQGTHFGVTVFTSTAVPTANAGADSAGMIVNPRRAIARGVKYNSRTEFDRDISARANEIVVTSFDGVVEIEDAAGVGLVFDR